MGDDHQYPVSPSGVPGGGCPPGLENLTRPLRSLAHNACEGAGDGREVLRLTTIKAGKGAGCLVVLLLGLWGHTTGVH